ncbi:potassium transporter [Clostridium thermosuccinogenes]|uniref:Potassium transporter n=1 Tax=Clostridium thermosuccinogenes TaxID=84032 RepID=A0A2K2FKX3_9CLOT|nr:cation:proton antiporter [Pseudoclostridium thermosuccinogenes]AUS96044.1 potassium transporter [Pseudoclostridium thermosuccinogenes]PNT99432.1 potassium transporter [Pseudoclostridium thermosuccinogenes]PNU01119.1 potassium transporter [Pseudoclostridium thermosuccinogenes]
MLLSLAFIFLCGMALGKVLEKLKMPSLLGMLVTGIVLGPYALNILDPAILNISTELRQIALIIILTRAGLNLDIKDLKKVGRPAILMCFVPACFEIIGMLIFAPMLLGISLLDAAIMGTVVAAVSPAVIVPRMIKLIEGGYGREKSIPQIIMAGASVDDVFVIILFTAFTGLAQGGTITPLSFMTIPTSIAFGLMGGIAIGLLLSAFFSKAHVRDSSKVIIVLSISFLLVTLEHSFTGIIGFSGLLAVMALGATLQQRKYELSKRLSSKFSKLWVGAEVLLFVLVGATVNINYAIKAGPMAIILILCVLVFRMLGVFVCFTKTKLNKKERIFSAFAYVPKATVQAAIGGLPLSMGLACGDIVLTVAVLSILITAPLGAAFIDSTYKRLLSRSDE